MSDEPEIGLRIQTDSQEMLTGTCSRAAVTGPALRPALSGPQQGR
jgi:hypothetical protein